MNVPTSKPSNALHAEQCALVHGGHAGTCLPRELQAPRASHRGHVHGEEDGHEAAGGSIQQRLHACMAHGSRITDHRSIRLAPRPHMAVMCSSVWPLCIRGWPGAHREGVTDDVVLERLQQRQAKACYALVRVAAARQVHAPRTTAQCTGQHATPKVGKAAAALPGKRLAMHPCRAPALKQPESASPQAVSRRRGSRF